MYKSHTFPIETSLLLHVERKQQTIRESTE